VAKYEVDRNGFTYPLSFIQSGDYSVANIMGEPVYNSLESPDLFPHNISDWIWGCAREFEWLLLCRLRNGLYVFYEAWCGPLGFIVTHDDGFTSRRQDSHMRLVAADTLEYLVTNVLNEEQYRFYRKKTVAVPKPLPAFEDSDNDIV